MLWKPVPSLQIHIYTRPFECLTLWYIGCTLVPSAKKVLTSYVLYAATTEFEQENCMDNPLWFMVRILIVVRFVLSHMLVEIFATSASVSQ